ncbi:MAG: hypothetical protein HZC41_24475 [Chloroflexi bacterium]|nr:hypothetical protein [Chloroflexota bacterium]
MDVEVLKGFLRIGVLVGGCGLLLALTQPPGTAEFVLSVCSALIGLALVAGVLLVNRFVQHVDSDSD